MIENSDSKANKLLVFAIVFFIFSLITAIVVAFNVVYDVSSKSCTYNGATYKHGETVVDECNSCSCQNGEVNCTAMACEEMDDYEQYPDEYFEEEFAATCEYEGEIYNVGEGFTATDGCNTCTCTEEGISCTAMACEE